MKKCIVFLSLTTTILLTKGQINCIPKGHVFLKDDIKVLKVKKQFDTLYTMEIYPYRYYEFDSCSSKIYRINYEYEFDTSMFIFFSSLPNNKKLNRINKAINDYYILCNKANSKNLTNKKALYFDNYIAMLHEFEKYWLYYKNDKLLNKIFSIPICDAMSADLTTKFTLVRLFISHPKKFIRNLLRTRTKKELRISFFKEALDDYIELKYRSQDKEIQRNKTFYKNLFNKLTS